MLNFKIIRNYTEKPTIFNPIEILTDKKSLPLSIGYKGFVNEDENDDTKITKTFCLPNF